tara:strand:- start:62 stop:283 length:222 start_codon:yes stop_codon:yes gene_type:complete
MTELLAIGGFVVFTLALFWGLMWMAERKALAELKLEQQADDLAKLREAINADVRGRERIARGELLQDDGHKRD